MQFGLSRKLNNMARYYAAIMPKIMTPEERAKWRRECACDILKMLLPYRVLRWYYRPSYEKTPEQVATEAVAYVDALLDELDTNS